MTTGKYIFQDAVHTLLGADTTQFSSSSFNVEWVRPNAVLLVVQVEYCLKSKVQRHVHTNLAQEVNRIVAQQRLAQSALRCYDAYPYIRLDHFSYLFWGAMFGARLYWKTFQSNSPMEWKNRVLLGPLSAFKVS